MYRSAISRLRAVKGCAGNLGTARYATSSAVASRPSSPGFFSWLTGEQASSFPPLEVPLSGVALPPSLPDYVQPGKIKSKVLENGLMIVSEASSNPAASVGLYLDCGSVYEDPISCGATHLLERMAFKSTRNRSHLRIVREVEAIGGNVAASASREQMGYTFDALKTYAPEMIELLIDCVRNPVFLDWEVNEELKKVKDEIAELSKNPEGLLLEAIHSAGFLGPLANPLLAPESSLDRLNGDILEEFVAVRPWNFMNTDHLLICYGTFLYSSNFVLFSLCLFFYLLISDVEFQKHYTAPRIVLAASGIEFEELISVAEPLLSDLPRVPRTDDPKSLYVGGDYRKQAASQLAHVALAFEASGGWHKEKDAIVLTVLQMLLGGGGSFSAGGPGKGMHSRLYLRVLSKYPELQSFSAFNSIFNKTGLFGIYASCGPDFVHKAVDVAVAELIAVATPGQVTQEQLNRAKESTKSAVLFNLESRMIVAEDIGRQFLTYGERKPVEHFLKVVDEITLDDITSIGCSLIRSPLTMASYGDVLNVPSYESVSSKFERIGK